MARLTTIEHHKPKRKGTQIVVWLLMAMLVVGLGGFGVTNFGGGVQSIGSVGDRDIPVNTYARALQQELRAFGAQVGSEVTLEQAQSIGLDAQVRRRLVDEASLDNETETAGLSVGDARVAQEITDTQAFQGTAGQFDRETYRMVLRQNNLDEQEFETELRGDIARSLLQGAVSGGFVAPAPLVDTLHAYIAERRGFSLLRLTELDLPAPLPEPTEAELKTYYDANPETFTAPETKRITYAALLPEDLVDTLPVDETALRQLYDERIADYVQPERRLVERLVFPTEEAAAEAKARIDAGTPFEDIVAERGLQLSDIDIGDVARGELGGAGDAIFGLAEPGVVGPLPSDLGPALFRMNGVVAAQETSFEEARADLLVEFQQDAARRAIADRLEEIDDMLASGATLEDLANDAGMTLGTLDYAPGVDAKLAGYPAFRTAADALQEGDFPEAVELDDGGLVALRLDEIVPPQLKPMAEVQEQLVEAVRADALARALAARAAEIVAEVEGGAALDSLGTVDATAEIARDGFVENVPETLVPAVFQMAEGEVRAIDGPGFHGVLRLDRIQPAPAEGEAATALKGSISAQAEQALAQDALTLFTNALTQDAGIQLNQPAINAVHAQFR